MKSSHPTVLFPAEGLRLGHFLSPLLRAFAEWRRRRAVLAELETLDEGTLRDLRIARSDFAAIADGSWKRR